MYFENIEKIKYEGVDSKNPLAYKYYDANKIVAGKKMSEHLKFAMSYWHTMCGDGTDMFGRGTIDKSFGGKTPMEIYEHKVYAAFELMEKLGIEYFCFHDRDIAPEGATLKETNDNLDKIVPIIKSEMERTGIKLLWGTANCFNNPRYMCGAGTSPNAEVFAYAASQIKKALEITVELGGQGYVFWGGREGYDTLLNTDMTKEQDNMAYLMKMAVDYGRSIGFTGDFYIEPKPKEPTKHQYDFDVSTVLSFLRKYGLDKDFKMNIEANHATLAGKDRKNELSEGQSKEHRFRVVAYFTVDFYFQDTVPPSSVGFLFLLSRSIRGSARCRDSGGRDACTRLPSCRCRRTGQGQAPAPASLPKCTARSAVRGTWRSVRNPCGNWC